MGRYIDENVDLNKQNIKKFFHGRAGKINKDDEVLTSVLYQDLNPQITIQRDIEEKEIINNLISLKNSDDILDIGCGIGRWAEFFKKQNIHSYHGVDFMEHFIKYAKENYTYNSNYTYQVLDVSKIKIDILDNYKKYSVIIISGVLMYLNDDILKDVLTEVNSLCSDNCLFIIREPISIDGKLTLKDIKSEELQQSYSAIYRTVDEFEVLFKKYLKASFFYSEGLYQEKLNNRKETKQHLFLFKKGKNHD